MQIKNRNLFLSAVFSVITCFLYTIYWIFRTKNEISVRDGNNPSIFLFLVPSIYFYTSIIDLFFCHHSSIFLYFKYINFDFSHSLLV